MSVKISICITTYNRVSYLERLLDSIATQTFKDFDILITDNSETTIVKDFVAGYQDKLPIHYHKNVPAVGMTENWNICMAMAKGEWIKLIHDDDWLATDTALAEFAAATNSGVRYIFSGRNNYYETSEQYEKVIISQDVFDSVVKNPELLLADNYVGQPSVLMFHSSVAEYYDPKLKWFVDTEYYMTFLKKEPAIYIDQPLLNICYNNSQMTNFCVSNPNVVLPELLYVLNKHKVERATDIRIYDAWWRLMRNMNIRSLADVKKYCSDIEVPLILRSIINHQKMIPAGLLKQGVVSKLTMACSYMFNINKKNSY